VRVTRGRSAVLFSFGTAALSAFSQTGTLRLTGQLELAPRNGA